MTTHINALDLLQCISCPSVSFVPDTDKVRCGQCEATYTLSGKQLIMTPTPADFVPNKASPRPPRTGTEWRIHNWDFLESCERALPERSLILDIGAGPGDFVHLFKKHRYVAVDLYPYKNLDLVCDLGKAWPFRPASADVIVCTNVVEHIYDGAAFIRRLAQTLRPGGQLWITVPFMIKIHQAPYDFHRYTHHALEHLIREAGLKIRRMEGVYSPKFLLLSALKNLAGSLGPQKGLKHALARRAFGALSWLTPRVIARLADGENTGALTRLNSNPYPLGYHIICSREAN